MRQTTFHCPATSAAVQVTFKKMQGDESSYESVRCSACAGVHFVNRLTGKTLGAKDDVKEAD